MTLRVTFDGDAERMVNRLCARHSKTPEEMVGFAIEHLNLMVESLQTGQSIVISKRQGESFLSVSDILEEGSVGDNGGDAGSS